MFTGLIQHVGLVRGIQATGTGKRLDVDTGSWAYQPATGDSIAVDGCCLTVAEVTGSLLAFDVVERTLELTTLGRLENGAKLNLEHAARFDSLIGGHIVQGHVDGIGRVRGVTQGADWRVRIAAPEEVATHLCDRGSITVNGVSLTIARVEDDQFEVALIPTTLQETNLVDLVEGAEVNLEADVIAKMVAQQVQRALGSSSTPSTGNQ